MYIIGHLRGRGRREIFPFRNHCEEAIELQRQHDCERSIEGEQQTQVSNTICAKSGEANSVGVYPIKQIGNFLQKQGGRNNPNGGRIYSKDGTAPTLLAHQGGHSQPHIIETNMKSEINNLKYGEDYKIRKLTPKECMRLQGVDDNVTDKLIVAGISDSQMYKAAGDAVTVPVVRFVAEYIKENMESNKHE